MSLQGKVVAIAGGGSGMGAAIAKSLATAGATVIIGGRTLSKLEEVAQSCEATIHHRVLDVADRASVEAFFSGIEADFGPTQVMINAAGINIPKRMMYELAPEDWDRVMAINSTGAYDCMRCVLPAMRASKEGMIINISSISGKRAAALGGVAYNASKFAMTALGISVAEEDRLNGIRVTNIFPGEVDTPILAARPKPVTEEHRSTMLQPEDLAAAVMMIVQLPPRAHIPELIIKPTVQAYV